MLELTRLSLLKRRFIRGKLGHGSFSGIAVFDMCRTRIRHRLDRTHVGHVFNRNFDGYTARRVGFLSASGLRRPLETSGILLPHGFRRISSLLRMDRRRSIPHL
ncbi:unnamed protein product, partial [Musa hybrid cultivar]